MDLDKRYFTASALLAFLFTFAFIQLTFTVPRLIHKLLINFIPDIGLVPVNIREAVEAPRPYGYAALMTIVALGVVGFLSKKSKITLLSSVASYLTLFGYFAFTMFVFAGIGVIRLGWLPLIETSPAVIKLGHVVILPYIIMIFARRYFISLRCYDLARLTWQVSTCSV